MCVIWDVFKISQAVVLLEYGLSEGTESDTGLF